MGEKVERISGSFFRGFVVGGANILPTLTRRVDSLNTPASETAAGAATYTAAQITRGIIRRDPGGASRTDVLPTAALLIAGVANQYTLAENGDTIVFEVQNIAAATDTVTLTAGAGMTLLGDTVIPPLGSRILTAIRTSATAVTVLAANPLALPSQVGNVASANATNSDQTYTAAQVVGGYLVRTLGANRTDTLPLGSAITTALPSLGVGSTFDFVIKNASAGAFTITLAGASGTTLIGTITVAQNETAVLRFVKTAASAYDIVKLG
jgi:hypothetical protein